MADKSLHLAGRLSEMGLRGSDKVGPGETEVNIDQMNAQAMYCDENGNPMGLAFFDNCNPLDFKDKMVRDTVNGADSEIVARRW